MTLTGFLMLAAPLAKANESCLKFDESAAERAQIYAKITNDANRWIAERNTNEKETFAFHKKQRAEGFAANKAAFDSITACYWNNAQFSSDTNFLKTLVQEYNHQIADINDKMEFRTQFGIDEVTGEDPLLLSQQREHYYSEIFNLIVKIDFLKKQTPKGEG